MVELLLLTGVVLIGLALWSARVQSAREQRELVELKRVREELAEAKKEVGTLLTQLEAVSEKVVEDIAAKVEEARTLQAGHADFDKTGKISESDEIDEPAEIDDLDTIAASDEIDETDEIDEIDEIDEAEDGGHPNHRQVTLMAGQDAHRDNGNNGTVWQQNTGPKEQTGGKTIIFPGRRNFRGRDPEPPRREEPAQEISPRHQMVYAMDKLGYSDEEIAKQLKMGKGEVRLMLELKRKGEEANV